MQTASFVFFVIGLGEIVWGFWGDIADKNPSPSIASRFESGIFFLILSFATYLIARKRRAS
jgi:hypothetical protein